MHFGRFCLIFSNEIGAMDVIVVRQADGSLFSTGWIIDVGRDASLSPSSYDQAEVGVIIRNCTVACMKIGSDGRCFFCEGERSTIYPSSDTLADMGLILGENEAVFEIAGSQSLFEATASIFLWDCNDPVWKHPYACRMLPVFQHECNLSDGAVQPVELRANSKGEAPCKFCFSRPSRVNRAASAAKP